jgi:hypothetical protein
MEKPASTPVPPRYVLNIKGRKIRRHLEDYGILYTMLGVAKIATGGWKSTRIQDVNTAVSSAISLLDSSE